MFRFVLLSVSFHLNTASPYPEHLLSYLSWPILVIDAARYAWSANMLLATIARVTVLSSFGPVAATSQAHLPGTGLSCLPSVNLFAYCFLLFHYSRRKWGRLCDESSLFHIC